MEAVTRRRSQGKGSDDPSCLKEENETEKERDIHAYSVHTHERGEDGRGWRRGGAKM